MHAASIRTASLSHAPVGERDFVSALLESFYPAFHATPPEQKRAEARKRGAPKLFEAVQAHRAGDDARALELLVAHAIKKPALARLAASNTERLALWYWTRTGYQKINEHLLGLHRRPKQEPIIDALTSVVSRFPKYGGLVTRAAWRLMPGTSQVGARVDSRAFVAGTAGARNSYVRLNPPYIYQIESRTGRRLGPYSAQPEEHEILFLPGARFEVVAVEKRARVTTIRLRELPGDPGVRAPHH